MEMSIVELVGFKCVPRPSEQAIIEVNNEVQKLLEIF